MLKGSNHVTDQHPIGQEAKDPNNDISCTSECRNGFTQSLQVFGTKNSPSPRNTHPRELCNYHDHYCQQRPDWVDLCKGMMNDEGICKSKPLVNNTALYCKGCVKINPYLPHHYCLTGLDHPPTVRDISTCANKNSKPSQFLETVLAWKLAVPAARQKPLGHVLRNSDHYRNAQMSRLRWFTMVFKSIDGTIVLNKYTIIYVFKLTPRKIFFHIPSFNIPHISSIHSKLEWNLNKCNVMLEQMMSKHARLSNDPNDCQQLRNIMVLFLHYCRSFLFYSVSINLKCL